MAPPKKPEDLPAETRARLIRVAGELFAERGFGGASVRDICARAHANVAAIRYHFGSKEALYREVLLGSHQDLRDREPIPRLADHRTAEAALEAWLGFVLRFLLLRRSTHSFAGQLIARELQQPTDALTELIGMVMKPVRDELDTILDALLEGRVTKKRRAQLARFVLDGVRGAG